MGLAGGGRDRPESRTPGRLIRQAALRRGVRALDPHKDNSATRRARWIGRPVETWGYQANALTPDQTPAPVPATAPSSYSACRRRRARGSRALSLSAICSVVLVVLLALVLVPVRL